MKNLLVILTALMVLVASCNNGEIVVEVSFLGVGGGLTTLPPYQCYESSTYEVLSIGLYFKEKKGECDARCSSVDVIITDTTGKEETLIPPDGTFPIPVSRGSHSGLIFTKSIKNGCVKAKIGGYDCSKTECSWQSRFKLSK